MTKFISILMVLASTVSSTAKTTVVTDASDGSALAGVSVFDSRGRLAELTDEAGRFACGEALYPLTLRSLGYEELRLGRQTDTVRLSPVSYALGEMEINAAERDVIRLTCYAREYASTGSGNDSISLFGEYMLDFFIPREGNSKFKASGTPRVLASKSVLHQRGRNGLDTVVTSGEMIEMLTWLPLASPPKRTVEEPESWRETKGPMADTIRGKSGFSEIRRRTPVGFKVSHDYLANHKSHRFSPLFMKLIGFTVDFSEMRSNASYRPGHAGKYRPDDLSALTFSMRALGRGKWIKKAFDVDKPVDIRSYIELYVVDREYLPTDEAKAMMKSQTETIEITAPTEALPLDAATARLLERAGLESGARQQDIR